jgi:hypothetical protein
VATGFGEEEGGGAVAGSKEEEGGGVASGSVESRLGISRSTHGRSTLEHSTRTWLNADPGSVSERRQGVGGGCVTLDVTGSGGDDSRWRGVGYGLGGAAGRSRSPVVLNTCSVVRW